MGKIIVGKTTDIQPGKTKKVSIDGKEILIIADSNGKYLAIDDTCTHAGASLSEGKLDGCKIICGWHGAEFDCNSGKLEKFPAKIRDLQAYKTTVESDNVFVEV